MAVRRGDTEGVVVTTVSARDTDCDGVLAVSGGDTEGVIAATVLDIEGCIVMAVRSGDTKGVVVTAVSG